MYQTTELVSLAVAIALTPLLAVAVWRTTSGAGMMALVVGYAALVAARVLTVAEGRPDGSVDEWLDLLEHASILLAGLALCFAAWRFRVSERKKGPPR